MNFFSARSNAHILDITACNKYIARDLNFFAKASEKETKSILCV